LPCPGPGTVSAVVIMDLLSGVVCIAVLLDVVRLIKALPPPHSVVLRVT
jgi:hypothetical protein